MSDTGSIATAMTLVDVDLKELAKSGTLLEEPVLLVTRLRLRGSAELPYLLTTPQGQRAGVIAPSGVIKDPETKRITRFDYKLLGADDRPMFEVHRSGDLRQSDTTVCAPGGSESLARITMHFAHGRRRYDVYDNRGAQGGVSKPFASAEVRSSEEDYVFKDAAGEVMAGAENMHQYYTYVCHSRRWMQRKLSSPPKPYMLYYTDPSTVRTLQLPIKSRKDTTLNFHEVRMSKVHGMPVQHTLPAGEDLRAFVLIAQFLIESTSRWLTQVDREGVLCQPSEVDQGRAMFAVPAIAGM